MAENDGNRVSRKAFLAAAGVAAAGVTVAAVIGAKERPPARLSERIVARRREGELPLLDPQSDAWLDADPFLVPILPQQAVPPVLESGGVSELTVEALHDGEHLGLRMSWDDPDRDDLDGIDLFRDALAVMLPMTAGPVPPITMGGPGAPVHLLQWRATWQRDIEKGQQAVEILYPNVVRDEPPEKVLPPEVWKLFYVGRVVGNPLSVEDRQSSVEEIVAEGFGSVTVLPEQRSIGFGVHDGQGWRVSLGLPLARGSSGEPLAPGSTWPVSFAIWLGSQRNRGGRKHFANWLDLELEA